MCWAAPWMEPKFARYRITARGLEMRGLGILFERLVGWRVLESEQGRVLLLKQRRMPVRALPLPSASIADEVAASLSERMPEDLSLEASKPIALAPFLAYASMLLTGIALGAVDSRILPAFRGNALAIILTMAGNLLIGPGLAVGWSLHRKGHELAKLYAAGMNMASTGIAMLFSLPFSMH
jgi:hypothetical protein